MNFSLPSVADLTAIVATLDQHPVGGALLAVLILCVVAGIVAYRWTPGMRRRP